MAKGLFWTNSISTTQVPSGDYFDSAEEDGIRIAGNIPTRDVLGGATVMKALDGGSGDIGDGVTATGSTYAASFSASYTANPIVTCVPDIIGTAGAGADAYQGTGYVGSHAAILAGISVGSAVFYGVSGTGFNWLAYGDKY